MRRNSWIGIAVISILAGFVFIAAAQNKGAAEMVLNGGRTGNVTFPHSRHQSALGDCNICHDLFPQEKGSIVALKESGKLKNKAVMKNCQSCHRKMAREKQKTGPTGCRACHNLKE